MNISLWICLIFFCCVVSIESKNISLQSRRRPSSYAGNTDPRADKNPTHVNEHLQRSYNNATREGKFFSLFKVVKFANDDCKTTTNENGTCFPANECAFRGGVASGSCASGFGVCCTFAYSCGQETYQNNSYFSNRNYPSSIDATEFCQLTVNKVSSNVCQLRLDFVTMVLEQPDGNNSNCNTDQFIVTGGSRVPAICGTNTGQHLYVDTSLIGNSPITLTVVTSGIGFSRQWRIKVTQIGCDSLARADNSCLQYYTGVSGTIRSFNYDDVNGRQLSNQDYSICIRTENNFCSVAYSVCPNSVFSISGPSGGSATTTGTPVGALVGSSSCNSDWLTIPCASDNGKAIQSKNTVCQDRLCGDAFASSVTQNSETVISSVRPFRIAVRFDEFETTVPTSVTNVQAQYNNRGFCLNYIQQPCIA